MRMLPDIGSRDYAFSEVPSSLSVLLLYEDAATALRAKQLVDQLVEHVNLVVSFRLNLCRFDLLNAPSIRQIDGDELLSSDILLLTAHGHDDLPPIVQAWLSRWLTSNPDQPRALVVSLDDRARNCASADRIRYFLQASGSRAGVEIFSHFGETQYSELDSAIASIRYRAETTSVLLDEALHRSGSSSIRFWGLNE